MKKFYLTVSLFSVIALTGCQDNKKQTMENESVKVKIMQVTASQDMHCKRFSGTVEEENGTALSFSVMGTVKTVHVALGQPAGDAMGGGAKQTATGTCNGRNRRKEFERL